MPKNRKLLSVGTPVTLANLLVLLGAVETGDPAGCIVKHRDGQLIIEETQATLDLDPPAAEPEAG